MRALSLTAVAALGLASEAISAESGAGRIRPWPPNPRFWEYKGKPVLLVGGSKDDNLFQIPDLREHLDELKAAGGNYIRNTMSDRRDKGFEVYPFRQLPGGKYDLSQWNEEYWKRFENLLAWTEERETIVQIEVWDRFDYSDSGSKNWTNHPYNPKNNINYTHEESGLAATYTKHPGSNEQPFFFTVPGLRRNEVVLRYQRAFVDEMLRRSLKRGNVLYTIDNETSGDPRWAEYWAKHIRKRAEEAGVEVFVTEMWDDWNLEGPQHRNVLDHPELYTFLDVSQNNHNRGDLHWRRLQWVRAAAAKPRPINCVKIYGADGGRFGNTRDGLERFWRNLFGGAAASRFHRPDSGIGLSEPAKVAIRSFRMLAAEFDFFRAEPDAKGELLSEREENEAYVTRIPGEAYAVYFPDGGAVVLDLSGARGRFALRWLDAGASRWGDPSPIEGGAKVRLTVPSTGHWVALVRRAE
ncbi:MAG: DUF6298 domain-containing protein [Planctomycetota bacterium]